MSLLVAGWELFADEKVVVMSLSVCVCVCLSWPPGVVFGSVQ